MLGDQTTPLGRILRRLAEERPDKPFIICGDRTVDYAETLALASHFAALYRECGLKKGDRVGVLLRKTPEAIAAFLGAAACGGVFFPLDFHQPPAATGIILDQTEPSVVVAAGEFCPLLDSLYPDRPPFAVIGADAADRRDKPGVVPFAPNLSTFPPLPDTDVAERDPVYLNVTSGTTGEPKGAVTTQGNLYWNTRASVEALDMDADDVHLCMMPVFVHPHELFARPLYLGGTMVLTENIAPKHVAGLITKKRVTCFMSVASVYETLVRLTDVSPYDFEALRIPESGGMHCPSVLVKQLAERFGVDLLPVWGSTETTGIAVANRPGESYRPGSMGRPIPHYDVRVLNKDGEETAPGEAGELVVSGPGVCPGYFGPAAAQNGLGDGRFYTGDVVRRDADGFLHFLSRRKHMMKVGGMKVYPVELEEVLRAHPDIAEVAVVPVPDALRGEIPKAVVVPANGADLTARRIRKFLEPRLHRHKIPRIITFCSSLPRTPGGKIAWKELSSA